MKINKYLHFECRIAASRGKKSTVVLLFFVCDVYDIKNIIPHGLVYVKSF